MMDHKIYFYGEIWLSFPKLSVTPSYLEYWEHLRRQFVGGDKLSFKTGSRKCSSPALLGIGEQRWWQKFELKRERCYRLPGTTNYLCNWPEHVD